MYSPFCLQQQQPSLQQTQVHVSSHTFPHTRTDLLLRCSCLHGFEHLSQSQLNLISNSFPDEWTNHDFGISTLSDQRLSSSSASFPPPQAALLLLLSPAVTTVLSQAACMLITLSLSGQKNHVWRGVMIPEQLPPRHSHSASPFDS